MVENDDDGDSDTDTDEEDDDDIGTGDDDSKFWRGCSWSNGALTDLASLSQNHSIKSCFV